MTQDFLEVAVDIGRKGNYVSQLDAKIRHVRQIFWKVKHGLLWKLPQVLVRDLMAYAVSQLNIWRTQAMSENVCLRVLLTDMSS